MLVSRSNEDRRNAAGTEKRDVTGNWQARMAQGFKATQDRKMKRKEERKMGLVFTKVAASEVPTQTRGRKAGTGKWSDAVDVVAALELGEAVALTVANDDLASARQGIRHAIVNSNQGLEITTRTEAVGESETTLYIIRKA